MIKEYKQLFKFIKPHSKLLLIASVCMAISAVFDGATISMIVPLVDKILGKQNIIIPGKIPPFLDNFIQNINSMEPIRLLDIMAVVVLVIIFLKGIVFFLQNYLMSDIGQKIVRDIRNSIYEKLSALSLEYFAQKRSGELVSRITNDVKIVENAVSYGFTDLIYQSFQVIIFTFLVFFIHWRLAIVSLFLFPMVTIPIIGVGKVLRRLSKKSQEKMADISSLLFETISGVRIVKAFSMEDYEVKKFRSQNHDYYKLTMKSIKRGLLLNPVTEFMGTICAVFVFFWGGREVLQNKISFGIFGLFLGALLSLMRPFKKLSQVNALNQQGFAASARIYEILNMPITLMEKPNAIILQPIKNGIIFRDLWFKYDTTDILKNINLEIKKGEIAAIVGYSGVGKTTLVDLIARFYDPYRGSICIDGIDLREATIKSLRGQIGIVTQETILFNDTIRVNIAYGDLSASQKDIEEAAKKGFAHDFIVKLSRGYDTVIGDRGFKLSGGERQRIAIARAILKNPPILILDEATSQLDSESERIVQEALEILMRGRTVFIIAHRLSTIKNANKIIILDGGSIAQIGSHKELLEQDGLYRTLYQMQSLKETK